MVFLSASGWHRVVHEKHTEPETVSRNYSNELHRLPVRSRPSAREIELIETFRQAIQKFRRWPASTRLSRSMPNGGKLLPIPRQYYAKGSARYGFHGLSYAYLMEELTRLGDPAAKSGRVILAHLGNGASMAAVRDGKSIDTTMGFTPTAGLVMSTAPAISIRPGPLLCETRKCPQRVLRNGQS